MWDNVRIVADETEHVKKIIFTKETAVAEAVLYRYPDYQTRTVICCSTQSGCPIGCRFCGSGDYFVRSLTKDEIVSQVTRAIEETGLNSAEFNRLQVMFMSMGEPMLNQKSLIPALYELHALMPRAELLISTMGPMVPYLDFANASVDIPTVGLQFSIHESTDEARNKLIPFAKKMNLKQISRVGAAWHVFTGRNPFINYCAHEANSSDEDADRLANLFDPEIFKATVSVICERSEGLEASNEYQRNLATDFASKLVSRGFDVRVFDPAGQDTIGGGCGQLWFVQEWMRNNPDKARPSIGFEKPLIHVPKNECN